jgi:hypothetical protein
VTEQIFLVKHLITSTAKDASLNVTEKLRKRILVSQSKVEVSALKSWPKTANNEYEISVHWRGLDARDAKWEPLNNLMEDIPQMVEKFAKKPKNHEIQEYISTL